ncbi:HesA/MoeB/ThiF family protein [Stenotrophomonas geniculata]|uniref:HesA/MoeB/ThiF family protein n=1 Tax=Stenotrophomonas geniculata TaxID=86188 RepID=UPI002E760F9C|nr:ThiF family adenylyltransferase [Stenotrophomonas geniculata]
MSEPSQAELKSLFGHLTARGFQQLPSRDGSCSFIGTLPCKFGDALITLKIVDWDFVSYPIIRVDALPNGAPSLIPHISAWGGFCYLAPGSVILDRFKPDIAVEQCLVFATRELDRLLSDHTYRQGEFQSELGPNWHIGQKPLPRHVLLGTLRNGDHRGTSYLLAEGERAANLISTDETEAARIAESCGWEAPVTGPSSCWIIRSTKMPTLMSSGLPGTIGDMFVWLKAWDETVYKRVGQVFAGRDYLAQQEITFVIESAAGWLGFSMEIDKTLAMAFRRNPGQLRQRLHTARRNTPIRRVAVSEISPEFVHSRNLTFPSLKDRRIVLVGCGSIGSYLSQALVRLGAGTGNGQLTLIDPDQLSPGNLGRHILGFESLFKEKAVALAELLRKQFPHVNIVAKASRARLPGDLRLGELVIDATGEEALSEAINFHRLSLPAAARPIVQYLWVTGQGQCTQVLWTDSDRQACYRCMRQNDDARTPRFDLGLPQNHEIVNGCQAFTPYAVSAPMSASALAIDQIAAWLGGGVSPRFRTRMIEGSTARQLKNQDVSPLKGCPACRKQ